MWFSQQIAANGFAVIALRDLESPSGLVTLSQGRSSGGIEVLGTPTYASECGLALPSLPPACLSLRA
jgi:hypothetical protein